MYYERNEIDLYKNLKNILIAKQRHQQQQQYQQQKNARVICARLTNLPVHYISRLFLLSLSKPLSDLLSVEFFHRTEKNRRMVNLQFRSLFCIQTVSFSCAITSSI